MKDNKYDIIVIGSGLGGLSVASLLANQEKKKVLVLEQHYLYGGYATHFRRKGSLIDISLHQTGGLNSTFYKNILKKCLVFDRIKWIKHRYLYSIIKKDGSYHNFYNADVKKNKLDLYSRYPNDKFAIWFWFSFIRVIGRQLALWEYGLSNIFTAPIMRILAPILTPLVVFSHIIKVKSILRTRNKELRKELFQLMGYFGDRLEGMTVQNSLTALYGYYYDGGCSAEGGGQSISDAFVSVIKDNGGTLKKNRTVEKIIVKNKKAIGVKTHRNEVFYSDAIISNANPISVFNTMIEDKSLIERTRDRLLKKEISITAEVIYIVLDCPIEELNPKFSNLYEVTIELPCDNDIVLTIQSNVYGKDKVQGKTVFNAFKIGYYKDWNSLSKEEYKHKKEEETNKFLSILEKYLPGIREHLLVCEYATPKTMNRYTLNEKGAIYGLANTINQTGFVRSNQLRSKIKNIYFSSAWAFPGGGYEGTIRSGYYIFNKYFSRKEKIRKLFFYFILAIFISIQLYSIFYIFS